MTFDSRPQISWGTRPSHPFGAQPNHAVLAICPFKFQTLAAEENVAAQNPFSGKNRVRQQPLELAFQPYFLPPNEAPGFGNRSTPRDGDPCRAVGSEAKHITTGS